MNIEITESNEILKDGESVGSYNPESNTVLSHKDIAPTVKGQISHLIVEKFNLEDRPSYDVAPANKPKAKKGYDGSDLMTNRDGDKTPAFIAWFKKNHTNEEFEARYAGRKYEEIEE